ncbi:MAG: DUF3365 domain-containing protein [bacterium]|nr:DUF3365 domain-containing protein [bacterium]
MADPRQHYQQRLWRLWLYAFLALLGWTGAVVASYWVNVSHERRVTREITLNAARAAFYKDLAFRSWAASHGGVYVPVTDATPPNPYLKVPERDILTPSGRQLTLLNPAYAFRQLLERYSEMYGVYGRITSLKPINPKNTPDPWERKALESFEQGVTEAKELSEIQGKPFLRMMRPLVTESGCLTCHAQQGYKLGDIRGGITVSVPMERYLELEQEQVEHHQASHALFYSIGLAVLLAISWRSQKGLAQISRVETALAEHLDHLEETVARRTQEAEEARRHAEEASASKAAFLASMSHEIRTPLSGVIGVANLLADTPLNRDQREYLDTILYSGDYLLMIINEVLDLSKIEAGKFVLNPSPTEPRKLIEETLDLFALKSSEARIELYTHFDPAIPRAVFLDRTRVRQILINLIGNSLKFTEKGEVRVELWLEPTEPDQTLLRFVVADTGPGIPRSKREHLFEAFVQGVGHQDRGTGLGLNISRRLVELMGGKIWLESDTGKGTQFAFTLPAQIAASPSDPLLLPDLSALKGMRLAVVSASERYLKALDDLLSPHGITQIPAPSPEALARIFATNAPCALIVEVPYVGENRLEWLKDLPPLPPEVIQLALVGLGERPDLPPGMQLIRKPVREETLLTALLGQPLGETNFEESRGLPNLAQNYPLKILLVEDNHINQMLALKIFEKYGYQADLAENGALGVEKALANAYDLIFMDIRMPVKGGIEATQEILAQLPPESCPVILAMTANLLPQDREDYLKAGMRDLLPKPIIPKDVGSVLSVWGRALKKKRHLEAIARPIGNPQLVNQVIVQTRLNVGGAFFEALRDQFALLVPQLIEAIGQAIHQGLEVEIMRLSHQLGGLAGNLGAEKMAAVCYEIEVSSNDNDLQSVKNLMLQLEALFPDTLTQLRTYHSPT